MCAYSAVRVFCFLINYQIQYVLFPNRLTTFGCRACTELQRCSISIREVIK